MISKSNNKNWNSLSDPAIVEAIGEHLKQLRLDQNVSQSELAERSGLNRTTISRLEAGRAATLLTVVQVLRALNRLDKLSAFQEEPEVSPLELWKLQGKQRKRASSRKEENDEESSEW